MTGSSRNSWSRIPLLIIGAAFVGAVACDGAEAKPPEHAHITYGDHWSCDRGFDRSSGACEPVVVPAHAFLDYSGQDWRCEHAYLNAYGNGWVCERGFERDGNSCKLS